MTIDYRIRKLKQEIKRLTYMLNYQAVTQADKENIKSYIKYFEEEIKHLKEQKRG